MRKNWSEAGGQPGARPHLVEANAVTRHARRIGVLGSIALSAIDVPAVEPAPRFSVQDLRLISSWDWPTANAA